MQQRTSNQRPHARHFSGTNLWGLARETAGKLGHSCRRCDCRNLKGDIAIRESARADLGRTQTDTQIGAPCDIERDDGITIQVRVAVATRLLDSNVATSDHAGEWPPSPFPQHVIVVSLCSGQVWEYGKHLNRIRALSRMADLSADPFAMDAGQGFQQESHCPPISLCGTFSNMPPRAGSSAKTCTTFPAKTSSGDI